jgi:hypothetical protein
VAVQITNVSPKNGDTVAITNLKVAATGTADEDCTLNARIQNTAGGLPIQSDQGPTAAVANQTWSFTFSNPVANTFYSLTVFGYNGNGTGSSTITFQTAAF